MSILAKILLISLIPLVAAIFFTVCHGLIYRKAGEPFWAAFVPIYNNYVFGKITGYTILGVINAVLAVTVGAMSIAVYSEYDGIFDTYTPPQIVVAEINTRTQEVKQEIVTTQGPAKNLQREMAYSRIESLRELIRVARAIYILYTILNAIIMVLIGVAFDKSGFYLIGLLIFPFIFIPMLAFEKSHF